MTRSVGAPRSLVVGCASGSILLLAALVYGIVPSLPRAALVGVLLRLAAASWAAGSCLLRGRRERQRRRWGWLLAAPVAVAAVAGTFAFQPVLDPLAAGVAIAGLLLVAGVPANPAARWRVALDVALTGSCAGWLATALPVAHPVQAAALVAVGLAALARSGYPGGPAMRTLWPLAAAFFTAPLLIAWPHHTGGLRAASYLGWVGVPLLVVAAAQADGTRLDSPRRFRWRELGAVSALVVPLLAVAGRVLWLAAHGAPIRSAAALAIVSVGLLGALRLAVARADDLRASRTFQERVAQEALVRVGKEQWFRELVQHSSDVIIVLDPGGRIRYVSPSLSRVLGHQPADVAGQPLVSLIPADDARRVASLLAEAERRPGSTHTVSTAMRRLDGQWSDTESIVSSLVDHPDIRGLVLNTRDVSERKRLEDELTKAAFHDPLTGLANRALFRDRVSHALQERGRSTVAVLFCDLDGFKAVNDAQGHAVGDQLLGLVAERLRHCVRPADTVARLGGDEFAVLVAGGEAQAAAIGVAQRVSSVLAEPFLLDGREIHVGASMGIASTSAGADSAELLLRNADLAMYRAKAGESSYVVFEPHMHDSLLARVALEDDLRHALARGQLAVHYQPTVELRTGRVVGVEGLLRWWHPERGAVPPEEFVGVAEASGLIAGIGEWALVQSVRQAVAWQDFVGPDEVFSVAVNISARQLQPSLVELVSRVLTQTGLPPRALLLEVTESVLLERTDAMVELLGQLKALGVRLAVDDFGTGYSSLSYLARFPVDVLKVDRSFIEEVGSGRGEGAELARTIVSLGQSLGLVTVAEGVQTGEQLAGLREMGCELGQGFLFSRPMPAIDITELLSLRALAPPAAEPLRRLRVV